MSTLPGSGSRRDAALNRLRGLTFPILFVCVVLGAWQLSGALVSRQLISSPVGMINAVGYLFGHNVIWASLGDSLRELYEGVAIAWVAGIVIGVVIGRFAAAEFVFGPFVNIANVTPTIVIIPLLVVWIGVGTTSRVVAIALFAIWPVLLNVAGGVRNVPRGYSDVVQAYGLGKARSLWSVSLPSALPYVMAGMRTSIGLGVAGMVVSEIEISTYGVGFLMNVYGDAIEVSRLLALVVIVSIIGVANAGLLRILERRVIRWALVK